MKSSLPLFAIWLGAIALSGCSVFGQSAVDMAPYELLEKEDTFELRHYEQLILVTTSMPAGMDEQGDAFKKLFDYISGKNESTREIPMTAPVFLDQTDQTTEFMSFVLPETFSIGSAPLPKDPTVKLEQMDNYTVAVINFSGSLNQETINFYKKLLEQWILRKGYVQRGDAKAAGYNPPFTIPAFRRNEVLIPIIRP